jgi:hypothetical protein
MIIILSYIIFSIRGKSSAHTHVPSQLHCRWPISQPEGTRVAAVVRVNATILICRRSDEECLPVFAWLEGIFAGFWWN